MKKHSTFSGVITLLGIVGIVYLGTTAGWAVALVAGFLALVVVGAVQKGREMPGSEQVKRGYFYDVPSDKDFRRRGWLLDEWFNHETLISSINAEQGWDVARLALQKAAYRMVRPEVPQDQKNWFREFMAEFVQRDPVYQGTIDRVREAVAQNPGMVQSEIYRGRAEEEKEAARYVLYFAHELGDIRREKAGRSYRLYLPEGGRAALETAKD